VGWRRHTFLRAKTNFNLFFCFYLLASSAVGRGFEPRLGPTKDYRIGICFFSAKHAALRRKIKNWLARNQNNVSE
jgi:hypothetical protein